MIKNSAYHYIIFFTFVQYFLSSIDYILTKAKRAHPLEVQTPPNDRHFLSQAMYFMLIREKTPLKSNKKRKLGTISCILFCVLIWWIRGEVSLWRICLLATHGSKLPCALLATCEPLFAHGAHLLILIFTAVCEGVRLDLPNKKGSTAWCSFLFGGSEGNRTPVRKPIHRTFSVGSLRFEIPLGRRSQTIYALR